MTEKMEYKPGFGCKLFWLLTWLGMLGGIAAVICLNVCWMFIAWGGALLSAVISYIFRTVEKNRLEKRFSWRWND